MHMTRFRSFALLVPLLFAGAVQAHPGHADAGFASGLLHPLTGLDHLLAMSAVGLWSALRADRMLSSPLLLPLLFVISAAMGTGLGLTGIVDDGVEIALAVSLLSLGLVLVFGLCREQVAAAGLVALCGALHGAAHGHEMAQTLGFGAFGGFLLGTALLHALGAGIAFALPAARRPMARIGAGGSLAAAGLWLLA